MSVTHHKHHTPLFKNVFDPVSAQEFLWVLFEIFGQNFLRRRAGRWGFHDVPDIDGSCGHGHRLFGSLPFLRTPNWPFPVTPRIVHSPTLWVDSFFRRVQRTLAFHRKMRDYLLPSQQKHEAKVTQKTKATLSRHVSVRLVHIKIRSLCPKILRQCTTEKDKAYYRWYYRAGNAARTMQGAQEGTQ